MTCLHSYTYHDLADVLHELMGYDRAVFCVWLQEVVLALPGQVAVAAAPPTRTQLVHFHSELTRAEDARGVADAIRAFSRLWR